MEGFRNRRLIHDGISAWQLDPDDFQYVGWHPEDAKVQTGMLSSISGNAKIEDNRGIFMTTGSDMYEKLESVLDWVKDVLVLHRTRGWYAENGPIQRRFPFYLLDILRQFYTGKEPFIASVTAEASRDPIGRRHSGFSQSLSQSIIPEFGDEAIKIRTLPFIDLKIKDYKLSTKDLRFVTPRGFDAKQTVLAKIYSRRYLPHPSDKPLWGDWTTWCVAEEDRDKLLSGSAPASKNNLLLNDVNPARLMTWWKLYPKSGWTHTIAFDLEEGSGDVYSIRYAIVRLKMQIGLDPWLDDWLLDFIAQQKHRSKSIGSRSIGITNHFYGLGEQQYSVFRYPITPPP